MAHAVIELYMLGEDIEKAKEAQFAYLNSINDADVKWGKKGSREQVIKDFNQAVKMFFEEMPTYRNVLGIERELRCEVTDIIDGTTINCPIPFHGFPDLIYEDGKKLVIEDYKFKAKLTTLEEGPMPSYWIQGIFYYYLVRGELKREPDEIRFREVKYSQNKDWSSQHNLITLNYKSEEFAMQKTYFWYQLLGMMKYIEDADQDTYFPYNIFDMQDGREAQEAMQHTVFGYKQNQGEKSDMVIIEKGDIKVTRFLETLMPETIEEKIKFKFQEFGIALSYEWKQDWYAFDRYLFIPSRGVKMSDIKKYAEDVAQATEMENIRIIAPVPWTKFVWVEMPREERKYSKFDKKYVLPIWRDIDGKLTTLSLEDSNTPHMIVAWRTWSGKSEFLKVLIESRPKGTLLAIVDPKYVELTRYRKDAMMYGNAPVDAYVLLARIKEMMMERYSAMEKLWVSDISETKEKRILVIIEEYANLSLDWEYWKEIEEIIVQLSNLGRAAWIHIVLATQRPDVKIISGRIKANIGCRVCFATASQIDSKIILDTNWAEKLSGKGDMLYLYPGKEPIRLQSLHI